MALLILDKKPSLMTPPIRRVVVGKVEAAKSHFESATSKIDKHSLIRNGVQVMPKEFLENPQRNADRLERPENVDKILPDINHDLVVFDYYAPTTKVIFVLGNVYM